jgi:hypothetical protein
VSTASCFVRQASIGNGKKYAQKGFEREMGGGGSEKGHQGVGDAMDEGTL